MVCVGACHGCSMRGMRGWHAWVAWVGGVGGIGSQVSPEEGDENEGSCEYLATDRAAADQICIPTLILGGT